MQQMKYYNQSFYIWGDSVSYNKPPLYQYEIATGIWTRVQPLGDEVGMAVNYGLCIYNHKLYSILGSWDLSNSVIEINLKSENYELERTWIDRTGMGDTGLGYYCDENMIYLFGGTTDSGHLNTLSVLDLDKHPLQFKFLSKNMKLPSARRGHAMQVYDDKLYIYGGITDSGSK
jgi:hypothetical protein